MESRKSYSTNKAVKRTFQRQPVLVSGIDDQFDADLGNLKDYADSNDNIKYLLFVIDIFSRYAWVEPLKDKSAKEIVRAFRKILSEGRKPKKLRTDAARDFTSKEFQNFMRQQRINHFVTHSEKQANYVERLIKTIKSRIFRYIIETNSPRYIDVLQKLVRSYNEDWHSGIRSEPINVTAQNAKRLWWQMYWGKDKYVRPIKKLTDEQKTKERNKKFKFKVGDKVRISYLRSAFQREYSSKWSNEIFQIYRRYLTYNGMPKYKIKDWFNERVDGTFHQQELQRVVNSSQDLFTIETVSNYRGRGRNKTVRVHWKGWPKKFDTILKASDIEDIR